MGRQMKAFKDEEQRVRDQEQREQAQSRANGSADYMGLLLGTSLGAVLFWIGPPSRWIGYDPTPPRVISDVEYYITFGGIVLAALVSWLLARNWRPARVVVVALWVALGELFVISFAAKLFWMAIS